MSANKESTPEQNEEDEAGAEGEAKNPRNDRIERKIDRTLQDSFPASDPPAWTLGTEWLDSA